jgi:glutamate-1-semialdehyde 2,1-aminomutase
MSNLQFPPPSYNGFAMPDSILDTYVQKHPGSAKLYEESSRVFPSGVTHDVRYVSPFPIFVDRAAGSHKWDVDGNEYVDYVMGHGALFMGHAHPAITAAIVEQAGKGTHYGANHRLELEWGSLVQELVPRPGLHRPRPHPQVRPALPRLARRRRRLARR